MNNNEKKNNGSNGKKRTAVIIAAVLTSLALIILIALLLSKCERDEGSVYTKSKTSEKSPSQSGDPTSTGGSDPTDDPDSPGTPVHIHDYGDWTVLKEPDCTTPGERERTCRSCGFVDKDDVSPLGHDGHNNVCVNCGKKALTEKELSISSYPYGDGLWITRSNGFTDTDVLIPDEINGEPVVCIAASAFEGNDTIVSLSLPDSVTQLGSFIFYDCPSLRMIRFGKYYGDQYTVIAGYCPNLDYLVVDPENKIVHSDRNCVINTETKTLIMGCSGSIIPDDGSVLIIDGYAFQCCSGLTSITVPSPVITIEQNAFTSCFGLISVDISDSVTTIEQKAFSSCRSLKEVRLPTHLKEIGIEMFYDCVALEEITIPGEVTLLYPECFYGCTSLKNVRLPEGLKEIRNYAFTKCSSLESITLPSGLTSLGSAFTECSSLREIVIPDGVEQLYSATFYGCSSLVKAQLPKKLGGIPDRLFAECASLTEVVIPDGVTIIDGGAFYGCTSLKSVTVPASLKYVYKDIFEECTSLEKVYFKGSKDQWDALRWDEQDECLKNANIVYNYKG